MQTGDLLRPLVEARGGALLSSSDSELLVLDRFLRGVLPLPQLVESDEQSAASLSLVDQLYARGEELIDCKPRFTVHTTLDTIAENSTAQSGLADLCISLVQAGDCDLIISFARPPDDWQTVLPWLCKLVSRAESLLNHVGLRGPFDLLGDAVKEVLFALGVRLGYVTGWSPGCGQNEFPHIRGDALRDLARFGFRIPIIAHVHADNINRVRSLVEEGLALNEHSGFSLPLIFCHPCYTFADDQPDVPAADVYRRLLEEFYRDIPYYDDVFFPVSEIAELVGNGGWCRSDDVPSRINLLARPEQGIGMFRQVPAFARGWLGWAEIPRLVRSELIQVLLDRHRSLFRWEENALCGRCSWRYVCGGTDAWGEWHGASPSTHQTACEHRKAFLEQFCREKARWLLTDGVK